MGLISLAADIADAQLEHCARGYIDAFIHPRSATAELPSPNKKIVLRPAFREALSLERLSRRFALRRTEPDSSLHVVTVRGRAVLVETKWRRVAAPWNLRG